MSTVSQNTRRRLDPREYTVGWITALPIEYAAATAMLDEQHESPDRQENDDTLYTLGQVHSHNVAIACLPAGIIGIASAANIATLLSTRFPNAKIGLMVGIGGGVPSGPTDIRLGDVVVSQPEHGHGGVLQYDMGKRLPNGEFEKTSHLDKPPRPLLNALAEVQKKHLLDESTFSNHLATLEAKSKFSRQRAGPDRLFQSDYQHTAEGPDCTGCNIKSLMARLDDRSEEEPVQIHYGTIASANSLIKDGIERDRLSQDLGGNILCFEMEAAGLMNNFPCLVIRGICDYADSHKNKKWQPYAAATAAAYAKEILSVLSSKEVAKLAPIQAPWVLPFNRNPHFTGRTDILEHLATCLQNPEHHPYAAIYGLGGSGKSAIAIELAYRTRENTPICAVFWISSFTAETFQNSYREIAIALQIPGADDPEQDMLSAVRRKLSGEDQGRWLIIVDNVDDRGVLFESSRNNRRLCDELPRSRHGVILFTTRNRKIAIDLAPDQVHPLGEMEKVEAMDLVRTALKKDQSIYSATAVSDLLETLTYLPLAIIQALSYMKANGTSPERYLALLKETSKSTTLLLQKHFHDPNRDRQSLNAVVLTWEISFRRVEQENQLAAGYLDFTACIAPLNIPRSVFPLSTSSIEQDEALGTLTAYAFLNERIGGEYFDVHNLIHHVTQSRIRDTGRLKDVAEKVIERLTEVIPSGGHQQAKEYSSYLIHGQYATDIPEIRKNIDTIKLLSRVGECYYSLGEYSHAVSAHQAVVQRKKQTIGSKHADTLKSCNSLGLALLSQGRWDAAEKLFADVIETFKQKLVAEHFAMLTSMANLASTYRNQGRWDAAEKLEVEVMETFKQKLGDDHPSTLTSVANLASTYRNQGRWDAAEKLDIEVMETFKQKLGDDHPSTLTSMANLASTYRNQGRWDAAEKLEVKVMETCKQKLAADHPLTLTSMANLASTFWNQGRWDAAEKLEVEVMETFKQKLGDDHPSTLTSMANLASTYRNQGRWDAAEKLDIEVMETFKQKLGDDHPSTLTSMANLASTYRNQGRWDAAEKLEVKVMETCKQKLAADHPFTLTSMANLASTYRNQGRWDAAEKLDMEVKKTRKQKLGADHPDTLTGIANLSLTRLNRSQQITANHVSQNNINSHKAIQSTTDIYTSTGPSSYNDMDLQVFSRSQPETIDEASRMRPYLTFTLVSGQIQTLRIKTWSRDQGWASEPSEPTNPYANSHTWFAIGFAEETDPERLYEFQRNVRASRNVHCHLNEWHLGIPIQDHEDVDELQGWLESLSDAEGTTLGIFPRARYPGYQNRVLSVTVEILSRKDHDHGMSTQGSQKDATEFGPILAGNEVEQPQRTSSLDTETGIFSETSGQLRRLLNNSSETSVINRTLGTNVGLGLAGQLHNFTLQRHLTSEHGLYQDEESDSDIDD